MFKEEIVKKSFFHKIRAIVQDYNLKRSGYHYTLLDIVFDESESIKLFILVEGIKKQIVPYYPEEIVYDDELLSEFSPCDVRTITYLSFQKYIREDMNGLQIEGQRIEQGKTLFVVKGFQDAPKTIPASELYQNHEALTKFSKKDMINVISTAVQEQTFLDIKAMSIL